jgi:hypothetical protein
MRLTILGRLGRVFSTLLAIGNKTKTIYVTLIQKDSSNPVRDVRGISPRIRLPGEAPWLRISVVRPDRPNSDPNAEFVRFLLAVFAILLVGGSIMAYSYTPAFVAFCGGAPLDEIAEEFNIPIGSLTAKVRNEGWRGLANRIAPRFGPDTSPADDILDKIEANRAKNYEAAAKLREHAVTIIKALCAGTLRIKKQFQHKGQVIEYEAEPGPSDWLSIATYLRTIADMTYRALGDHEANGRYRADAGPGGSTPAPSIEIVLPDAIAKPREQRQIGSPVVDINSGLEDG